MTRKGGPTVSSANGHRVEDWTDHSSARVTNISDAGGGISASTPSNAIGPNVRVGKIENIPPGGTKS